MSAVGRFITLSDNRTKRPLCRFSKCKCAGSMRNVFQEQLAQVTTTGIMSVVPSPLATADVHVVHEEYKQYPLR